jgi:hypothetical protein
MTETRAVEEAGEQEYEIENGLGKTMNRGTQDVCVEM